MAKWTGVGERIAARLKELGYWKNGRPDVMRFGVEKGYPVTYLYKWLKDATPDRDNLTKLGVDLAVAPAWILFGDEVDKAPSRPRQRIRRALACLAGAGVLLGVVAPTRASVSSEAAHYNCAPVHGNAPYRKWWHRLRGQALPDYRLWVVA